MVVFNCILWLEFMGFGSMDGALKGKGTFCTDLLDLCRITCVSDSSKLLATSYRFGLDKYLLTLNCFSNSSSCWDVNAVRGRRFLPYTVCCPVKK